jgi:hypothetical protein
MKQVGRSDADVSRQKADDIREATDNIRKATDPDCTTHHPPHPDKHARHKSTHSHRIKSQRRWKHGWAYASHYTLRYHPAQLTSIASSPRGRPSPLHPAHGPAAIGSRRWHQSSVPSVFGRNLQCQPVRGLTSREEYHWLHVWQRFKRSKSVKLNGTPRV